MSTKTLILSSAGLKNLTSNLDYTDEFTFIIGEHEIKMNNIYAEFISPYVSRIHQTDPTINFLNFSKQESKTKLMSKINDHYLSIISAEVTTLIDRISRGYSIIVDQSQIRQLKIVSVFLKNDELFTKLDSLFVGDESEEEISLRNADLNFLRFILANEGSCEVIEKSESLKFLASHFYSIDENILCELPKSVFYAIICQPELRVESEDKLVEMIDKYFEMGANSDGYFEGEEEPHLAKMNFYEEIEFNQLSESKFNEVIEKVDLNEMTNDLWRKLKGCFYTRKKRVKNDLCEHKYLRKTVSFECGRNPEDAFNGIIHEMTKEKGGNVDDTGVVKVTSSSSNGRDHVPKYAVDLDDRNFYFQSVDSPNSWLLYDFKNRRVSPTGYSIRTRHDAGKGSGHPKNWRIEGSNDGENWTALDERSNITSLDDRNAIDTFEIEESRNKDGGFRYLRIFQTGPNTYGGYCLTISALEYFGTVCYG